MAYISTFFGIVIRMFYREHRPPHFHAEYQGMEGEFDFEGQLLKGNLKSHTATQLIRQWAQLHKAELEANWRKIERKETLDKIEPLM